LESWKAGKLENWKIGQLENWTDGRLLTGNYPLPTAIGAADWRLPTADIRLFFLPNLCIFVNQIKKNE
jgi:hypothetical protein